MPSHRSLTQIGSDVERRFSVILARLDENRQIETEITVSHTKSSRIRFQFRQIRFELD